MSEIPCNTPNPAPEADSVAEQLLGRRVPPADAETAPGDATPNVDFYHRGPNRPPHDFIDRAVSGQ